MPDAPMLIEGATLIDGVASAPLRDAAVLITGDRIIDAGPSTEVAKRPEAADAERVDARGCWIVPGLIDAHVHTTLVGFEAMPAFLAAGVTTIRDVGGPLDVMVDFRDRLAAGESRGPRFIFCGPLIDGDPLSWPEGILPIAERNSLPDAAVALADACVARGAGSIKLYYNLARDSLRAVIRRIDGRVPVTGHLGRVSASEAVEDGIDGFEHAVVTLHNDVVPEDMRFNADRDHMPDPAFWQNLLRAWAAADLDAPRPQALLEAMRRRDVALDATLVLLSDRRDDPDAASMRYVRDDLRTAWEFLRTARATQPEHRQPFVRRGNEQIGEYVRRYHALGGTVATGTDTGAIPFVIPGFGLHDEMRLHVEAGIAPADVICAATSVAARALRIDAEVGSIRSGKCADLVILEADPLADIRNIARVRTVIRAGVPYTPADLLAPFHAATS